MNPAPGVLLILNCENELFTNFNKADDSVKNKVHFKNCCGISLRPPGT